MSKDPITIKIDDRDIREALSELARKAGDLAPAMGDIGELLVDSTKRRFGEGRAPDGTPWAPNAPSTILRFLHKKSGVYDKTGARIGTKKGYYDRKGRIAARGVALVIGKRPLIGESRALSTKKIHCRAGQASVEVGSSMEYSAVQQFGAKRGAFGSTRRGAPIPWGDIPARPFLGLSSGDKAAILDIISGYLKD